MGRRTIAIVLAIVLALAAAGLVWWYVGSVKTQVAEQEEMTTVLVAKEDIPARATGEAIVENGLVAPEQVPVQFVAPGALTDESQLNGQVIQASLSRGQQLVSGRLASAQEESLAFQIDKGMRAVSVSIDRVRGVGGLIREGDRIDVLATFE